jgi:hypothetical protein
MMGGQVLRRVVVLRSLRRCLHGSVTDAVRHACLGCNMHGIEAPLLTQTRYILTGILLLYDLVLVVAGTPCSSPIILLAFVPSGGSCIMQWDPPTRYPRGCVHSSTSYVQSMLVIRCIVYKKLYHIFLTHVRAPNIYSYTKFSSQGKCCRRTTLRECNSHPHGNTGCSLLPAKFQPQLMP